MDRLAMNAMLARKANMSYGKWKAMQEPVKVKEAPIPEGWQKCEHCGKPFKPANGKRFCDIACRTKSFEPIAKEMRRAYYIAKRKGNKDDSK